METLIREFLTEGCTHAWGLHRVLIKDARGAVLRNNHLLQTLLCGRDLLLHAFLCCAGALRCRLERAQQVGIDRGMREFEAIFMLQKLCGLWAPRYSRHSCKWPAINH